MDEQTDGSTTLVAICTIHQPHRDQLNAEFYIFSRPYLSNGRAISIVVVRPSLALSVRL